MNKKVALFIASLFFVPHLLGGREENEGIVPSVAPIIPKVDTVHGDILVDNGYMPDESKQRLVSSKP